MTEQEIIEYLKKNKETGIAFGFMPNRVREWVEIHPSDIFMIYSKRKREEIAHADYVIENDDIICLPDYYEPKQEKKGKWVEFEIDQKGNFHCFKDDDMHYFFWANWGIFLKAFSDEYTAFGGWQYEDSKRWYLAPAVKLKDGKMWNSYIIEESGEATPAIPIKIRFWRENK